jgi:hypothetical protein
VLQASTEEGSCLRSAASLLSRVAMMCIQFHIGYFMSRHGEHDLQGGFSSLGSFLGPLRSVPSPPWQAPAAAVERSQALRELSLAARKIPQRFRNALLALQSFPRRL